MRKMQVVSLAIGCLLAAPAPRTDAASSDSYYKMSLAELLDVEIVTSARTKQKLSEAHSTVKVITAEEIRQLPVTTLGELFKLFAPGMDVRPEHDKLLKNYLGVRGLSGDSYAKRILFLLDGRPLNSPVDGDFDTDVRFPLSAIKRIEIIRGPGSSLYGANAFQGTINIITGTSKDEDGGSFSGHYGEYGNYSGTAVAQRNVTKDVRVFVAVEADGASEYGVARNIYSLPSTITDYGEGFDVQDVKGHVAYKGLTLGGGYHHEGVNDSAKGDYVTDPANPLSMGRDNKASGAFATLQFDKNITQHFAVTARSYYTGTEKETRYAPPSKPRPGTAPKDLVLSEMMAGIDTQASWTPRDSFRFLVGGDFVHKGVETELDRPYLDGQDSRQGAAFAEVGYTPVAGLDLVAGGRQDWHSDFRSQFSPRVSALGRFKGDKGSVRLSYGTAFRAPTFTETYYTKQQFPDLEVEPETLKTFEASAAYQFTIMKLTATYFHSTMSDRIVFERVSNKMTYRNAAGEASADGVELEADAVLTKNVRIFSNYTFQDTRSNDQTDAFRDGQVYAPEHKAQGGVILSFRKVEGSLAAYWIGKQRDYFYRYNNPLVPSYLGLFGRVGLRVTDRLLIGLTAKNLLNSRYYDKNGQMFSSSGAPITDALTLRPNYYPPRTIFVDVRVKL